MTIRDGNASFAWATDNCRHSLGDGLDASFLSDEACSEGWFIGAMAGLCCQDLTGSHLPADFNYFKMQAQASMKLIE